MPSFLKHRKSIVLLTFLILFQMILISIQVPIGSDASFFDKMIFGLFAPIKHGTLSLLHWTGKTWREYIALHNAQKQNDELKRDLFRLGMENDLLRGRLSKFQSQAELLEKLQAFEEYIIPGRIIGIDSVSSFKSVTVNKGKRHGVEKDMYVLNKNGFLVGRVIEPIASSECRIQLITDQDMSVGAYFKKGSSFGIISGENGSHGICRLHYIINTETGPEEGNSVFTSGLDQIFPPDIPIGRVISVEETDDLFKSIRIRPFFDIRNLDLIAIIAVKVEDYF